MFQKLIQKLMTKTIQVKYIWMDQKRFQKIDKGDWIDLPAGEDRSYKAGDFFLIPLNVAMQLPAGYEAHVVPRGSTFKNFGIIQTNSMGIIDNSYCGDNDYWFVPCYALRDGEIKTGERICQFRIVKKMGPVNFVERLHLGNKDRGGHGSTGK